MELFGLLPSALQYGLLIRRAMGNTLPAIYEVTAKDSRQVHSEENGAHVMLQR